MSSIHRSTRHVCTQPSGQTPDLSGTIPEPQEKPDTNRQLTNLVIKAFPHKIVLLKYSSPHLDLRLNTNKLHPNQMVGPYPHITSNSPLPGHNNPRLRKYTLWLADAAPQYVWQVVWSCLIGYCQGLYREMGRRKGLAVVWWPN